MYYWGWHCIQSGCRTSLSVKQSLEVLHRILGSSTECHWWILSKAFLKSMKLIYSEQFHSRVCSMMFLNAKIWSVHPLLFQNPACSCLSCLDSSKKDSTEDFAGDGQERDSSPIVTDLEVAFLKALYNESFVPVTMLCMRIKINMKDGLPPL